MIDMIKFEMKKLFKSRINWIALFILTLINLFKIYGDYELNTYDKAYSNGYFKVYESISGEWDHEKVDYVIEEYNRLTTIIQSGDFSTEPNQPNTYTGYVFGDQGMFEQLKNEMEFAYKYGEITENIISKANENISFFAEKNNVYEQRLNQKIVNAYSDRSVPEFHDIKGMKEYFNYDYSTLLLLILIILFLSPIFSKETEIEMDGLLKITKNGHILAKSKLLSGMVVVGLISTFFLLQDLCFFSLFYRISGFSNPIYSIEQFALSPLNMSITGFIVMNIMLKVIAFIVIGLLVMLFSSLFSDEILPFCLSLGTVALLVTTGTFACGEFGEIISFINPVSLLTNTVLFENYDVVKVFDYPIFSVYIYLFIALLTCVLLSILIMKTSFKSKFKLQLIKREKEIFHDN